MKKENIAWCPKCFKALDEFKLYDEKGNLTRYIYGCYRCERTFELKQFDLGDALGRRIEDNGSKLDSK